MTWIETADLKEKVENLDLFFHKSIEYNGTWILLQRRRFELFMMEEPYHTLTLLINITSKEYLFRIFGVTRERGFLTDNDDFYNIIKSKFESTVACVGSPRLSGESVRAIEHPFSMMLSSLCQGYFKSSSSVEFAEGKGTCPQCLEEVYRSSNENEEGKQSILSHDNVQRTKNSDLTEADGLSPSSKTSSAKAGRQLSSGRKISEATASSQPDGGLLRNVDADSDESAALVIETEQKAGGADEPQPKHGSDSKIRESVASDLLNEIKFEPSDAWLSNLDNIPRNEPDVPENLRHSDSVDCEDMTIITDRKILQERIDKRRRGRPKKVVNEDPLKIKKKLSEVTKKKISDNNKIFSICKLCQKQCKGFRGLVDHMHKDHPDHQPWHCHHCPVKTAFVKTLYKHLKQAHSVNECSCPICGKSYARAQSMLSHYNKHEQEKIQGKSGGTDGDNFSDSSTKKDSKSKQSSGSEGGSSKCDICEKQFSDQASLKEHKRTHTKERPYQCTECGSTFSFQSTFLSHRKMHLRRNGMTEEEAKLRLYYSCNMCDKSYVNSTGLKMHKKHVHFKISDNVPCEVCGTSFRTKELLKQHQERHHAENPRFSCDFCGQRFGRRYHLNRHRLAHSVEGFPCDQCSRIFRREDSLNTHKKAHSRAILAKQSLPPHFSESADGEPNAGGRRVDQPAGGANLAERLTGQPSTQDEQQPGNEGTRGKLNTDGNERSLSWLRKPPHWSPTSWEDGAPNVFTARRISSGPVPFSGSGPIGDSTPNQSQASPMGCTEAPPASLTSSLGLTHSKPKPPEATLEKGNNEDQEASNPPNQVLAPLSCVESVPGSGSELKVTDQQGQQRGTAVVSMDVHGGQDATPPPFLKTFESEFKEPQNGGAMLGTSQRSSTAVAAQLNIAENDDSHSVSQFSINTTDLQEVPQFVVAEHFNPCSLPQFNMTQDSCSGQFGLADDQNERFPSNTYLRFSPGLARSQETPQTFAPAAGPSHQQSLSWAGQHPTEFPYNSRPGPSHFWPEQAATAAGLTGHANPNVNSPQDQQELAEVPVPILMPHESTPIGNQEKQGEQHVHLSIGTGEIGIAPRKSVIMIKRN